MKIWAVILLLVAMGCKQQPYSKDYIYTSKDDYLPLQDKVNLLKAFSSIEEDDLLAAIASLYAQNKNFTEAKISISRAIKINPIDPTYHLFLASYNAQLHYNVDAYHEAKVAFELGAYDAKLESFLARMALETLDSINIVEYVTNYYNSNPENTEAQLLMARYFILEDNYVDANALLLKIIKKDSLNVQVWETAFAIYERIDSIDAAIKYGTKLIHVDSANALYYFKLGNLYQKKGALDKAAFCFAQSYRYNTQVVTLYLALDNYTELNMLDSVLYYSDPLFVGNNFADKQLLLVRAQTFSKRFKYQEADQLYNRLVQMDSTDSVVVAEQAIIKRKISYLQRKKMEQ